MRLKQSISIYLLIYFDCTRLHCHLKSNLKKALPMPRSSLTSLAHRHNTGLKGGIASICSAHPLVIEAAFLQAKADCTPVLIEATCNQVNQDGGYTGGPETGGVRTDNYFKLGQISSYAGNNAPHNNMPPYYVLVYIMKL